MYIFNYFFYFTNSYISIHSQSVLEVHTTVYIIRMIFIVKTSKAISKTTLRINAVFLELHRFLKISVGKHLTDVHEHFLFICK